MSLEKEFGIPKETINRMVNRGVISCSIVRHYEIYDMFLEIKKANPNKSMREICFEISDKESHYSFEMVKTIVNKLGNK